ncbi:MAG: exosortase F system-associated protein [Flavobacteriaceae bacterium]|jgi:exosortase F-associated protein|nr:exosortase F system-associated protein [Flavobacteriaceae bacterium]MCB0486311.1 exosortase F system-associated protein [Flavobacteriaceae bacterium]
MKRLVKIITLAFLVLLLVLVRAFGDQYLYDPFTSYFQNDYLYNNIPKYDTLFMFFNLFVRYFINAVISLMIIYVAFHKKPLVIFSIKFYAIAFVVLAILYYLSLRAGMGNGYLFTFYVRRFLIHPMFILILLPAFYYHQRILSKK